MLANFPNQLFSCILAPSMSSKPFSGIIGHEAAISCLGRMLEDGTLAHAYLFVGQPRVGKRAVALALLNALFSVPGHIGSHPDIVMIRRETDEKTGKEKTAVSVEQVRDACERLSMTSLSGGRKALFIEEADRLNAAAGNALLKTLEEPRGDAIIILRANSVDAVPATIASRCQIVRFHPVPPATIAEAFVKRGVDREEAASLAQASFGAPGAALSLLTDGEYRAQEETAAAAAAHARDLGADPARTHALVAFPKRRPDAAATARGTDGHPAQRQPSISYRTRINLGMKSRLLIPLL